MWYLLFLVVLFFWFIFVIFYIQMAKKPINELIDVLLKIKTNESIILIAELKDLKRHINFWGTKGKRYNEIIARSNLYINEKTNEIK